MQKKIEATTFNMWADLKEKAKIFIAYNNRQVNDTKRGEKLNMSTLLNMALDYYLEDVNIEDFKNAHRKK